MFAMITNNDEKAEFVENDDCHFPNNLPSWFCFEALSNVTVESSAIGVLIPFFVEGSPDIQTATTDLPKRKFIANFLPMISLQPHRHYDGFANPHHDCKGVAKEKRQGEAAA